MVLKLPAPCVVVLVSDTDWQDNLGSPTLRYQRSGLI